MNRTGTHTLLLVALLALGLAASAGAARAGTGDGDPLGDVPALSEYIEEVPTAKGPKPTSTPTRPKGSGQGTPATPPAGPRLSPAAEQRLGEQPKAVARKLRRITSSSHYGASETAGPDEQARARRVLRSEADAERAPTAEAFGTVFTAATSGGDAHLSVLLVIVLLATAAAVAAAAQRGFGKSSRGR